jgi:hypothetical protein
VVRRRKADDRLIESLAQTAKHAMIFRQGCVTCDPSAELAIRVHA